MNHETPDERLKDQFRQLREADEIIAPSFTALLSRDNQPKPIIRRRSLVVGLGGVAVCVAVAVIVLVSHERSSSDEEFARTLKMAESITQWKAPTDVFLGPPHPSLLRDAPEFDETLLHMNFNLP
jgi:hypothetical protein